MNREHEDRQEYDFDTRIYYPWFTRKLNEAHILFGPVTFNRFWEFIHYECSCTEEQALEWWSLPND
jgi:hypothetical protein